jgi:6-pyruvoyltetrahydropterin/6-carboxytetrahydropterin synthase
MYRVRVTKDSLVFSAAHFITIADWCERLHGHNWRVAVEVSGPLDANEFVVDFIALRDELMTIVQALDHSMLIPTEHPTMKVTTSESEVEVRFQERRWIFPKDECRLLPIPQTTAERLAWWIGTQFCSRMQSSLATATLVRIEVEENFGQWASCDLNPQAL